MAVSLGKRRWARRIVGTAHSQMGSEVKAFASRMLSDHAQLAQIKGGDEHGHRPRPAYIASEISRLRTMADAYRTEATSGPNAALGQYASDRLPVVQLHPKDAEALPKG